MINTLKQLSKVSKFIGLLRKLNNRLPWSSLTTIHKSFVRPHLDHGDVIADKTYNNSFQQRLQSLQCNASSAITGVVKGSSTKVYQWLGLESLQNRWCFQKLCVIYKIVKEHSPKYLLDLISSNNNSYQTRNSKNLVIRRFKV